MDKKFLLNQSKTFCMSPWIHINTSPVGEVMPCCISRMTMGSTVSSSVKEVINNDQMKQLRRDMLNEVEHPNCQTCYDHEKQGIFSFRNQFNERYSHHFDEVMSNTLDDGHLTDFKMRYFDLRFSNICNFKCRTCNSHFSSQWEQENIKRRLPYGRIPLKNNRPDLVTEIIEHIPFMEYAYFAGGEPLITEEHYILLEEMIRQGRTDIKLLYNSNVSSLKFKNKDILDIWSKFDNPVDMSASIDHIGSRAEYMRHGTKWNEVEENLRLLKNTKNVNLLVNTVLCAFNYLTLDELYYFFIDSKIYTPGESYNLYPLSSPECFSARVLSKEIKQEARSKINALIDYMEFKGFTGRQRKNIYDIMSYVEAEDQYLEMKGSFKKTVLEIDHVRSENFVETFPELKQMFE